MDFNYKPQEGDIAYVDAFGTGPFKIIVGPQYEDDLLWQCLDESGKSIGWTSAFYRTSADCHRARLQEFQTGYDGVVKTIARLECQREALLQRIHECKTGIAAEESPEMEVVCEAK